MKIHRWSTVKLLAVTALLTAGLSAAAFAGAPPKGKVVIKECQKKKPPVTFDHGAHVKLAKDLKWKDGCATCHHKVDGKMAKEHKCTTCHSKPQGKLGTCQDMSMKKNPFHVVCITCHKSEVKAGKVKAPTKCAQCHSKG